MIIYLITNDLNNRRYVGQTIHPLEHRWSQHIYTAQTRPKSLLHRDMHRCGVHHFKPEILAVAASRKELDTLEAFHIKTLKTLVPHGYNLTTGGQGHVISEITKRKISATNKRLCVERGGFRLGLKSSPEHIRKISSALTGKTHSNETRAKISRAKTNPSKETRQKLRESHLGHHPTLATRQKMRLAIQKRQAATIAQALPIMVELQWNRQKAAKRLNRNLATLYRWFPISKQPRLFL